MTTPPAHPHPVLVLAIGTLAAVALAGCAASAPPAGTDDDTAATSAAGGAGDDAATEPSSAGLEEVDFGSLTWEFRPGGAAAETFSVDLVDGTAADGMVSYELGEVVLAELTGDDRVDAAVQITRLDGNAVDDQWYLWIATDEGPVQSTLPVARTAQCGTATHSVEAVDGGIEIHETRRTVSDQAVACSELGSDERTRTVGAIEVSIEGGPAWWPVQHAPFPAYGGLCPGTTHLDSYPNDAPFSPVPDLDAGSSMILEDAPAIFEIESWPVYDGAFPGWVLAGVMYDGVPGCAWTEIG